MAVAQRPVSCLIVTATPACYYSGDREGQQEREEEIDNETREGRKRWRQRGERLNRKRNPR